MMNTDFVLGRSLFDYYRGLGRANNILVFKGGISQDTLVRIGELIRVPPEESGEDVSGKRLFAIMVEMTQNILYYSQEREVFAGTEASVGAGIIVVQQLPKSYDILCGNVVNIEQKEWLARECGTINSMTQEQLREYYCVQRRKIVHHSSKGAGLGLIDIARKSKNPLDFAFQRQEEELYFFSLSTSISRR